MNSGMGRLVKDMTGMKIGELEVIRHAGSNRKGRAVWLCVCSCGERRVVLGWLLRSGGMKSCGCMRKFHAIRTHGMSREAEYGIWQTMKDRCTRKKNSAYKNYGGRGITVCTEWMNDFTAFYKYVGPRPSGAFSLDRIDNDGNYEPGNVQWATRSAQNENRRLYVCVEGIPTDLLVAELRRRGEWPNQEVAA